MTIKVPVAASPMEMSFRELGKLRKEDYGRRLASTTQQDCVVCVCVGEAMFKADTAWDKQQIRQKTK